MQRHFAAILPAPQNRKKPVGCATRPLGVGCTRETVTRRQDKTFAHPTSKNLSICLYGLIQFGNAKLQPLYFPFDAVPVDQLPGEYFHKSYKLAAADKDRCVHDLRFSLLDSKKFDCTEYGHSHDGKTPYPNENYHRQHSSVVKVSYHGPDCICSRFLIRAIDYLLDLLVVHSISPSTR
jgi:hypothetical protein